ncbi:hypothetical protein Ancab_036132, partial [Ancistrocladus abbreviatus]
DDGILVMPTFADQPPKLGGKEISPEYFENRLFCLSSVASMSGCCQVKLLFDYHPFLLHLSVRVTVALSYHDKCPVLVSFIARHGSDRFFA